MFTYPYLLACKQCPLKVTIVMTNFSVFQKFVLKKVSLFFRWFQTDFWQGFFQTQEKTSLSDNIFWVNIEASCAKS